MSNTFHVNVYLVSRYELKYLPQRDEESKIIRVQTWKQGLNIGQYTVGTYLYLKTLRAFYSDKI